MEALLPPIQVRGKQIGQNNEEEDESDQEKLASVKEVMFTAIEDLGNLDTM